MKIEDGGGNGKLAKVNDKQRLDVSAATFSEAHLVSALDGQAYTWTSSYSAGTGEEIIYIKNNSKTKKLVIESVEVGGVPTGFFEIHEATETALLAGGWRNGNNYGDPDPDLGVPALCRMGLYRRRHNRNFRR